jgi:positive regulator of sigma E activity
MYIAVSGMRHAAVFRRADAHPSLHAAVLVRYMGMIWAWAAMTMLAIYQFLLEWPLWLGAFILLLCGALSLLFVAKVLDRDAMDMNDDPRILRLVTGITRAQFGLTCIALGGLLATGKLSVSAYGVGPAWAAVNILIATALALAIMSGYLMTFAEQSAMDASAGQQPRALVKRRVQAAPSTPVTFRPTASVRKAEPARMRTA